MSNFVRHSDDPEKVNLRHMQVGVFRTLLATKEIKEGDELFVN